ncbi:MAG: hypothetical protein SFW36_14305 [Leptolyngbyaceae cyanobacterium bins.59]|nr:hypothetical protein [Leptolyngbyaceae cyanobacterium bins.59]
MYIKVLRVFLFSLLFLGTTFATVAYAQGGEGGGNAQSPVQVIVQIVVTAIVIKILDRYDLP